MEVVGVNTSQTCIHEAAQVEHSLAHTLEIFVEPSGMLSHCPWTKLGGVSCSCEKGQAAAISSAGLDVARGFW